MFLHCHETFQAFDTATTQYNWTKDCLNSFLLNVILMCIFMKKVMHSDLKNIEIYDNKDKSSSNSGETSESQGSDESNWNGSGRDNLPSIVSFFISIRSIASCRDMSHRWIESLKNPSSGKLIQLLLSCLIIHWWTKFDILFFFKVQ